MTKRKYNPADVISMTGKRGWQKLKFIKQKQILGFIEGFVDQHGFDFERLIPALIHMFDIDEEVAAQSIVVYRKETHKKNPAVSERQRRFMCAELARKRTGKRTVTDMTESQLRDYCKKNPVDKSVEIYSDILAIEATKGKDSLWPNEQFRHDFKSGSKIYGLPDGSILIKSIDGKNLWKMFQYSEEDIV